MASTSTELHAREVIDMMRETGKLYTRESLARAIDERFGTEARFYTCAGGSFTAIELVEFLASHGKIAHFAGGFTVDPTRVCQH